MSKPSAQLQGLLRGSVDCVGLEELATDRPLRIKVGFDPTAPDLHLGHSVVLTAMRRLQDAGHELCFVVGDFTAQIGDPTGRDTTRPPLSDEQIKANALTYMDQAGQILDMNSLVVRRNSEWLGALNSSDWIRLAACVSVAQMLERDDFKNRYLQQKSISLHEFLYPLAQAQDSVELEADIEMGGTDQLFNLLLGREVQRQNGQKPQAVVTWPLLEGLDGVRKMSKSLNNAIALREPPNDMFGKVMSISDEQMWVWFELLTMEDSDSIKRRQAAVAEGGNPRDHKLDLATDLVKRYWGEHKAQTAHGEFLRRFSQGELPSDMRWVDIQLADAVPLSVQLREWGLVASSSEARRLMLSGAVSVNGERWKDPMASISKEGEYVIQAGKRRFLGVRAS